MSDSPSLRDPLASARTTPAVAVALLEALRSSDTPEEVLEDEDVQQSLPRRLGLSEVVDTQIRRYRELNEQKITMSGRELADLFVLVARRPDAEAVFERAGSRLTRRRLEAGRLRRGMASAPLPHRLQEHLALRTARTVAESVNPGGSVRTERDPPALVLEDTLSAATGAPEACQVVGGALSTALSLHGVGEGRGTHHPLCEARGDSCCVWRLST